MHGRRHVYRVIQTQTRRLLAQRFGDEGSEIQAAVNCNPSHRAVRGEEPNNNDIYNVL